MSTTLETLFAPAEYALLPQRDLGETVCVVFDILRASTTMMTALANGAREILPVAEIADALSLRQRRTEVLLGGERNGLRIRADQTGGIDFDFGNSPREYVREKVSGKSIVMTTTNGTRALQACAAAQSVLVGSFLGLNAVARWIDAQKPRNLLLVCSGTAEQASYEDTLAAGALCDTIWPAYSSESISDSAMIARQLYLSVQSDLLGAMPWARNGRRLLAQPDLRGDVPLCVQRDTIHFVAELAKDGAVRRLA